MNEEKKMLIQVDIGFMTEHKMKVSTYKAICEEFGDLESYFKTMYHFPFKVISVSIYE
jgi:hypothetical protein